MTILQQKLDLLKSIIPENQWMYFHIESIENFIYHLDSFKSEKTRARAEKEIESYFVLAQEEMENDNEPREIFKNLTAKKLYSLGLLFEDELKFIPKPYYPLSVVLYLVLFFVVLNLSNIYIAFAVTLLVVGYYEIRNRRKIRERKYY